MQVVHHAQDAQCLLAVQLLRERPYGLDGAGDPFKQLLTCGERKALQRITAKHSLERKEKTLQSAQGRVNVAQFRRRVLRKHAGYLPHAGLEQLPQLRNLHFHTYVSLNKPVRTTSRPRSLSTWTFCGKYHGRKATPETYTEPADTLPAEAIVHSVFTSAQRSNRLQPNFPNKGITSSDHCKNSSRCVNWLGSWILRSSKPTVPKAPPPSAC